MEQIISIFVNVIFLWNIITYILVISIIFIPFVNCSYSKPYRWKIQPLLSSYITPFSDSNYIQWHNRKQIPPLKHPRISKNFSLFTHLFTYLRPAHIWITMFTQHSVKNSNLFNVRWRLVKFSFFKKVYLPSKVSYHTFWRNDTFPETKFNQEVDTTVNFFLWTKILFWNFWDLLVNNLQNSPYNVIVF